MSLKILSLSGVQAAGKLNTEWILIANEGDAPFNAEGCSITVSRGSGRPRTVTTFQAGLIIKARETCRLVTGSSGKKSHGEAPQEENIRNVPLFLKASFLERPGLMVRFMNRQLEICRAVYEPSATQGVLSELN